MTYSRPGVYVNERDLPTPVISVGTADAAGACIGYFQKGPETITRVTSWYDFATTFGDMNSLYPATYGVNNFFQNGGNELYVRRVTNGAAFAKTSVPGQTKAAINLNNLGLTGTTSGASTALTLSAASPQITVGMSITGTNIAASTYVAAISGTALTLSQASSGSVSGTLTFGAGNATRFVAKAKGVEANLYRVQITPVVFATKTTGTISYASNVVTIAVDNTSGSIIPGQFVTLSGTPTNSTGFANVVELPVATTNSTTITVNTSLTGTTSNITGATLTVYGDYWNVVIGKETNDPESPDVFANDLVLETYNSVVFNNKLSSDYLGTILSLKSSYLSLDETTSIGGSTGAPYYTNIRPAYTNPLVLSGGTDGSAPGASDYTGTSNATLKEFDVLERPLVFFMPELVNQVTTSFTEGNVQTVQNAATSWAESNGKVFVVLDIPSGKTVANAITWGNTLTASSYAGMYFPNYYVADNKASSSSAVRLASPSSAMAGLILSTDRVAGPFKSAAGISAKISGAIALETAFTSSNLDDLAAATNPVNAIRNLPGAGIVAMGARTFKTSSTVSKYISTRRSLFYVKRQMEVLTQFALFENNSETLWTRVRTTIEAFLNDYRNQGGLRGATTEESFYVKCDAENNDAVSIAAGIVNVEVGVALERPAEFIVINLSQMTTI